MATKKIAPEPPRRHCSIRNSRTLSQDGSQIQASNVPAHGMTPSMYYGAAGGGGGGVLGPAGTSLHPHAAYLQQQASQPIYANYATIQQTTAEIHCEKFHDNKVRNGIFFFEIYNTRELFCSPIQVLIRLIPYHLPMKTLVRSNNVYLIAKS